MPLESRDVRLRLMAELFEAAEKTSCYTLASLEPADVELWYNAVESGLKKLDEISQEMTTVPGLPPAHFRFYWNSSSFIQIMRPTTLKFSGRTTITVV